VRQPQGAGNSPSVTKRIRMDNKIHRTKIVATIGPASRSPEVLRELIRAGMNAARLNFSHGSREDHALTVKNLRAISDELDEPVTLIQDLQGPKVRVGNLAGGSLALTPGKAVEIVPESDYAGGSTVIPIDYSQAAEDVGPGSRILMADGVLELEVSAVSGRALRCRVIEGGELESRKGVNFPGLNLQLPSLTDKDKQDLDFGLALNVDWISLSFVRDAADLRALNGWMAARGARKPVIAKIEKPQAVDHIEEILDEADGIMVARGDLGVEMSPEKVPMIQKRIIELCNRRGVPVITATQMLESMIHEPLPTRAEASDVANAIIDGTDAVMLSGESAVGVHPVRAVEMMARIAREVESRIEFKSYPPAAHDEAHALAEATGIIGNVIEPRCIVVMTASGHTVRFVAAERPKTPVIALTPQLAVYHALNLFWGIKPIFVQEDPDSFDGLIAQAELILRARGLAAGGDKILVIGGIPARRPRGANFIKIHTLQ